MSNYVNEKLREAYRNGNIMNVKRYLAAGADVNSSDPEDGATALMTACYNNRVDMMKLILSHPDIDMRVTDTEGLTALDEAR